MKQSKIKDVLKSFCHDTEKLIKAPFLQNGKLIATDRNIIIAIDAKKVDKIPEKWERPMGEKFSCDKILNSDFLGKPVVVPAKFIASALMRSNELFNVRFEYVKPLQDDNESALWHDTVTLTDFHTGNVSQFFKIGAFNFAKDVFVPFVNAVESVGVESVSLVKYKEHRNGGMVMFHVGDFTIGLMSHTTEHPPLAVTVF